MAENKPMLLPALFTMKCPSCRKSNVFVNRWIFPLGKLLMLKDYCDVCGQKMKSESNNGGGINYALTVMIFFLNLLWYIPIFGISAKDNSIYHYLVTSIVVVILLQPFLMRLSRMTYLYLYIRYGNTRKISSKPAEL